MESTYIVVHLVLRKSLPDLTYAALSILSLYFNILKSHPFYFFLCSVMLRPNVALHQMITKVYKSSQMLKTNIYQIYIHVFTHLLTFSLNQHVIVFGQKFCHVNHYILPLITHGLTNTQPDSILTLLLCIINRFIFQS